MRAALNTGEISCYDRMLDGNVGAVLTNGQYFEQYEL
jgi:hypothetical protein